MAERRPDPIKALAAAFKQQASDSALKDVLAAFHKLAQGLPKPAAYPRTRREPEAETYRWFVANEHITKRRVEHGFALPHVLDNNQDLPYLQPRDG